MLNFLILWKDWYFHIIYWIFGAWFLFFLRGLHWVCNMLEKRKGSLCIVFNCANRVLFTLSKSFFGSIRNTNWHVRKRKFASAKFWLQKWQSSKFRKLSKIILNEKLVLWLQKCLNTKEIMVGQKFKTENKTYYY